MQQSLDSFINEHEAVDGALIATLDGTLYAQSARSEYPIENLASMGGDIMALGDAITAELNMGECRNLIAENERGAVIFMHITQNLVLVTATRAKTSLGMLLMVSKRRAEDIAAFMRVIAS